MPNFSTPGGEVRFVDFVSRDHMLRVHRAIAAEGIDLGMFSDPSRSKFPEVRKMAQEGPDIHDEAWRLEYMRFAHK